MCTLLESTHKVLPMWWKLHVPKHCCLATDKNLTAPLLHMSKQHLVSFDAALCPIILSPSHLPPTDPFLASLCQMEVNRATRGCGFPKYIFLKSQQQPPELIRWGEKENCKLKKSFCFGVKIDVCDKEIKDAWNPNVYQHSLLKLFYF